MGFVTGTKVGNWLVFSLLNVEDNGWAIWTDPISGKTRVWDERFPDLMDDGLLSDDWDRSFNSQRDAWEYIEALT